MNTSKHEVHEKFEREFKVFVDKILAVISEVGAGSVLKKLCADAIALCSTIHDDTKSIDNSTLVHLHREIEFYNKLYTKPSKPSNKRLLNDAAVILFSMNNHVKNSNFASGVGILLDVIKIAVGLC
ncbi:MAG TPA: hypothetical protein VGV92_08165 [Gammaproteobacteria bacterium]|nr:hypothetical protein [Gammaproteobacteria bacterium]